MGVLKYSKSLKVFLRECGLDEKWLQDRIAEDPTILGLGDLALIERERIQPKGRLDLLLADFDSGIRYVTEIQLGSLDESHIIRTIEYWDIERKRFPNKEHYGVIVAEDVTSRFLNVLTLLNSSIPIIVLQLDCRSFEGNIFLNFLKVLDHVEQIDEEESAAEKTDLNYWLGRANKESMEMVSSLSKIVEKIDDKASLTYNKYHIALGGEGKRNYIWFHPRKSKYVNFRMRFLDTEFEDAKKMCEDIGLEILNPKKSIFGININKKTLLENQNIISELVEMAKKASF